MSRAKVNDDEETAAHGEEDEDGEYISDGHVKCTELYKFSGDLENLQSSLLFDPLFYFPELEDPDLYNAMWGEPEPKVYDDAGLMKYFEVCKENNIIPMRRVTKSLNKDLLNFNYFGLKPETTNAMLRALTENAYIETVSFEENRLSEESLTYLSKVLETNNKIAVLNLRKCFIGPKAIGKLSQGLWKNKSLREIDLSFNNIEDEGMQAIGTAIQYNKSIKKLNLSNNNLTEGTGVVFHYILEDNYMLHELDLSWNFLYNAPALQPLMDGLKENISIESLNLSWNGIGEQEGFYHVFSYIKSESTSLKFINLSNNRITGVCVRMLKAALKVNESLIHVDLSYNPLTTDEMQTLAETFLELKETSVLESIDFGDKYIKKTFIRTLNKITKKGYTIKYGGIYSRYKIHGPNLKEVLFKRAKFLAMKPKKKKLRKDFGHVVLKFPDDVIAPNDFVTMLKKQKVKLDQDLVQYMSTTWYDSTKKVDLKKMKEDYMHFYPDTVLPPVQKKGKKGKKKKQKK